IFLAVVGLRRRPGDSDEPYVDGHRFDRDPEPVGDGTEGAPEDTEPADDAEPAGDTESAGEQRS
ncbi:MAG: hypothetical protein ACXV5S_11650, partial [Acidimicrobiales bacterium]